MIPDFIRDGALVVHRSRNAGHFTVNKTSFDWDQDLIRMRVKPTPLSKTTYHLPTFILIYSLAASGGTTAIFTQ